MIWIWMPCVGDEMVPNFSLGQCVATPGALEILQVAGVSPLDLLSMHARGDWGNLSPEDQEANERALVDGSRVFSSYLVNDQKVWVITEAEGDDGHRASTCIMMADEY